MKVKNDHRSKFSKLSDIWHLVKRRYIKATDLKYISIK